MSARLFIGNLSYSASEADIRAAFAEGGFQPTSVTVVLDRETGQSRGFGFVELESPETEEAIKLMDGTVIGGRPIRVSQANERERRPMAHRAPPGPRQVPSVERRDPAKSKGGWDGKRGQREGNERW